MGFDTNTCSIQQQNDWLYIQMSTMGRVTQQQLCMENKGHMVKVIFGEDQSFEINEIVFNNTFQSVLASNNNVIDLRIFNKNITNEDMALMTGLFTEGTASIQISKLPIFMSLLLSFSLNFQFKSLV